MTEHNLHFYGRLMREARAAISSGTYEAFARGVMAAGPDAGDAADEAKNNVA